MKRTLAFCLLVFFPLSAAPALAADPATRPAPQTRARSAPAEHEVKAEVPELMEFHRVIARMWHGAWPKKDFEAMAALLPEIESGAGEVERAALPGILRDKKPAWDEGVGGLGRQVAAYREAVAREDLQALLDAGEELHAQFERLVRLIRPALKEIDDFHQVLYQLYHYDLPAFDLDAIRADARAMRERMAALNAATLPGRLQARQGEFEEKRRALGERVEALAAALEAGAERPAVEKAVESVHGAYVALEGLF